MPYNCVAYNCNSGTKREIERLKRENLPIPSTFKPPNEVSLHLQLPPNLKEYIIDKSILKALHFAPVGDKYTVTLTSAFAIKPTQILVLC